MIKDVWVKTVEDLMPLLTEQDYRWDLDRHRNSYLYRGMPNSDYKMVTSLRRCCKEKQRVLEPAILGNFAKYAVQEDETVALSFWYCMICGQHNGLPTRLLDWSHSALTALHFATTEDNLEEMDDHDCVVWRVDMAELNGLLPGRYREELDQARTTIFTVPMLRRVTESLEQYDRDMENKAMVIVEPPSINRRIISQYSFFSIVPMDMEDIEGFLEARTEHTVRYIIDRKLRWRARDMLDQLNISERMFFPGLEGLSKWIARHYYVKN